MTGGARRTAAPSRSAPVPLWGAVPLAALGGLTLDLAFPSVNQWVLAFVAIVLSLLTLIGRRAASSFLVGLVFGAAFYFPHVDWAARFLGDNDLAWVPWVALASVESVFMGAGAILLTLAYRWSDAWRGWTCLLSVPTLIAGLWTTRELIMGSWPYGGFAWGRIGMSQAESPLAPVASWVGVSGLTFLIVLWCAMLIEMIRMHARSARAGRVSPDGVEEPESQRLTAGRRALIAVPLIVVWGVMSFLPQFPTTPAGTMTVGAVQGNGPAAYMDQREFLDVANAQFDASAPIVGTDVDVVLWPEGGMDADPLNDARAALFLDIARSQLDAPLIMNAAVASGDEVYNMSMVWEAGGPTQTHSKRNPVPFGEYVPDRAFYERIVPSLIGMIGREYTPGTDAPLFDVAGTRIGLAICFDVISDELIREGALGGAQAYMFQTNNADFRGTDENLQQLSFARMRAIETGRTVVNLSTVGTSQIIAPDGTTTDSIGIDEADVMIADIELRDGLTAGVVLGPWIQGLIGFGSVSVLAALGVLHRLRR